MGALDSGWSVLRQGLRIVAIAAREQPRAFTAGVIGSTLFAAATVGSAYLLSTVIARFATPAFETHQVRVGAAVVAALIVLSVTVLKVIGILVRRIAVGQQQFGLVADYRRRVLGRYLELPYAWHLQQSPGALLSTAGSDVDATWFAVSGLPLAVGAMAICVFAIGALLITDPVLALVGAGMFPVLVLINVMCSRRLAPPLTAMQQLRAEVAGIVGENVDGAHVVRALGRADAEVARLHAAAERLGESSIRTARVRALFNPFIEGLPSLGSLLLLLVGVLRMEQGAIGIEQLLSVTFLFSGIAFPLASMGWMLGLLPTSVVGWERLQQVLAVPLSEQPPTHGGRSSSAARHGSGPARLEVRGAGYRYDGRRAAVAEVSFIVSPGRTLAIAGTTGSGKSTLGRLIVGLIAPSSGTVLLDGTDVRAMSSRERSLEVGYVPQETFLFADTVRGNLALDLDLPDEALWEALRAAQAEEFVAALPDGLDAAIGERGGTLSGGQRQRLALARAFVRRPRLLVLDDATSGLDPAVESAVVRALSETAATTVVISDRSASLASADEVVFLDAGRLVASGSHQELLATEPDYARLVRAHGAHA